MKLRYLNSIICAAVLTLVAVTGPALAAEYKGPCDTAVTVDGKLLLVAEQDASTIGVIDLAADQAKSTIELPGTPTGICLSPDDKTLYAVYGFGECSVAVIDLETQKITSTIPVGHGSKSPCVSPDGKTLYVCNRFDNDVSVVDLESGKEVKKVACLREPFDCDITPDGKTLFVSNQLPADASDSYDVACEVTWIDTTSFETDNIRLLNGTTDLMGLCVSPDGKYAMTVSILARYQMPTTQLERGWMNTNAMSIIDVEKKAFMNTVLLDDIDLGAANPWGITTTDDGTKILIAHAGTHEVSVIDGTKMFEKLNALPADREAAKAAGSYDANGAYSSSTALDVPNDLAFLVGLRQRVKLQGNGPRGLSVTGNNAFVAMYFTDTVDQITDLDKINFTSSLRPKVTAIALGPEPEMTEERLGNMYFHDAALCFQHWQSCASCHPDARVDALNWDLMNDGMGNPKNVKSMLLSHVTPPSMISGIRADAETAVRAGIKHIQFAVRPEADSVAIDKYLMALVPYPSPLLVDGQLSEAAKRGEKLFNGSKANCARCHPADTYYTDMKMHDLKTKGPYDRRDTFDTPTLVECWRTYPYLHDGRHVTMKELLDEGNHGGAASKLHDEQLNDLVEFVLSL